MIQIMNRSFIKTHLAPASLSLAGLSLMVLLSASAAGASSFSAEEGGELVELVNDSTLSGSFLAGQVAAKANDDQAAVAFYQRSVELDPDNTDLKHLLFLALAANGRIDEAVSIAKDTPTSQSDDRATFNRLVRAVEAVKSKSWQKASELLEVPADGDLDRLVERLIVSWSSYGSGNTEKAFDQINGIVGPDWIGIIRNYHAGLMASASGDDKTAIVYLKKSTQNQTIAAVLSETFLRAVEALIIAQARSGDLEGAKETLAKGFDLISGHPPFHALRDKLESEKPLAPLITSAQQGAAEIFYNVGTAISRQGGAPFAQSYLQLANYLRPDGDVILMSMASLFEKQKSYERANDYYRRVDKDSPYFRRSQLDFALNLNDLKRVDESKEVLNQLIEQDPADLVNYITLGAILSQKEEYAEAAKIYDKAAEQIDEPSREHWNLFYRRGIAHERLKEWDQAEENFKRSLELNPNQADVLNYLGYSWVDMGINLEEGMDMIRKAVDLKPQSGFIVDSLGWAYYKLGKYEDAVRELERAVEIMPGDPVINDHLGDAYWKTGRKLEATFQWNHALDSEPEPEDRIQIEKKLKEGLVDKSTEKAAAE